MVRQLIVLNFKWKRVEQNDAIFTYCQEGISIWILRTLLYASEEEHSQLRQAPKMDLFPGIVNSFTLTLLTIYTKRSIVNVWRAPE